MAHYRIHKFDTNNSFEDSPISEHQEFIKVLKALPQIKTIQPYAYKACILKAKDEIQGVVLKGVSKEFDWSFFRDKITEGRLPNLNDSVSDEVLISKNISEKLQLKCGDHFLVFFIQKDRKVRKLKISGIYQTGLSDDFDNLYLLCDIRFIRKINNWEQDQVGGFEIFLKDFDKLEKMTPLVYKETGYQLNTQTVKELYPQIFNWLELQNLNVMVIITLITLVAGITMISTLLILVLENTRQIGLLKAMGASDNLVGKTFGLVALNILIKGLLIGNILGITLGWLQLKFGLISLPVESYYISKVPVNFTLSGILLINACTIVVCLLMLLLPSRLISKIDPIKVLRFD